MRRNAHPSPKKQTNASVLGVVVMGIWYFDETKPTALKKKQQTSDNLTNLVNVMLLISAGDENQFVCFFVGIALRHLHCTQRSKVSNDKRPVNSRWLKSAAFEPLKCCDGASKECIFHRLTSL